MSEIQEIDVFINPNGTVKYEIRGVKGQKCLILTKDIIEQLGGMDAVIEHIKTDEFYEDLEQHQDETIHQTDT